MACHPTFHMKTFGSTLRQFVVPNGLLLLSAALLFWWAPPPFLAPLGRQFIALPLFGAVAVLAWRFRISRVLLMVLLLFLCNLTLFWIYGHGGAASYHRLYDAIRLLLPINIAALWLIDEATFDVTAFELWIGCIALQPIVVYSIWLREFPLNWQKFPLTPLTMSIFLSFIVSALLIVRFWISRSPRDAGLFWSLCAGVLALTSSKPLLVTGWLIAAACILGVAVIETSYFIAYHDELTRLPARRAFKQMVARLDENYSIAMVDIDHFKQFNDTFGHDVGDQVLRMVASKLAGVGGDGKAFRYGGEEFAIVFTGKCTEEVQPYAEELRRTIAESMFVVRGMDRSRRRRKERRTGHSNRKLRKHHLNTRVTVSMGLANHSTSNATVEDVIEAADKALYRAKEEGRNRVVTEAPRTRRVRVGR